MDVAFQMRGVPKVILVDAAQTGSEPGAYSVFPAMNWNSFRPHRHQSALFSLGSCVGFWALAAQG